MCIFSNGQVSNNGNGKGYTVTKKGNIFNKWFLFEMPAPCIRSFIRKLSAIMLTSSDEESDSNHRSKCNDTCLPTELV